MAEIADITPSNVDATDRLLVRREGSAPFGLDLLADLTPAELLALRDEIIEARGDRSRLTQRISTISNFASPNAGGIVPGNYYDGALHGANALTPPATANWTYLAPFYTSERMRISLIGAAVGFAEAGSFFRCAIYGAGADNWPDDLLFAGENDLDSSTTGYKSHSLDFTFDAGRQYYLGFLTGDPAARVRAIPPQNTSTFGVGSSPAVFVYDRVILEVGLTSFPQKWPFSPSQLQAINPPSIRVRASAL